MAIAFNVGDKVEVLSESDGWGNVSAGDIGMVRSVSGDTLNVDFPSNSNWIGNKSCFKLISSKSKSTMTSILTKFQTTFLPEPKKTFRQAGITKDDGSLTTEGQEVFLRYLLKKNGVDFKKEVVDVLLADEKK